MAHCVLPDLTLIAVFRANPGRRSQTRPYRSYFCIPQQSDPLSVPSVIGMLLIGTLCLCIEDSRPMAITGRMGFLVSHRTDCGLHRSRILYVPFSPPRTFTFRATYGRVGLPIAILPLLVLMTIGIARRFNDYGITLNRLYLLTLNIWFYIVCIGLFVLRARRIQWIAVSFAGIFLLTSVLPVNYARLTHRYMFQALSIQIQTSYKGNSPWTKSNIWTAGIASAGNSAAY